MIVTRDLVPGVYYNESRDFQTLGRTFEILFNHVKTNVDLMKGLPFSNNCDVHLLPLLATSLGFANKRNYSKEELKSLCSSFIRLLRLKGSKEAVVEAVNLMLHAHNIDKVANVEQDKEDRYMLNIYIPVELDDVSILEDIFEYILPCGFTYNFINTNVGKQYKGARVGTKDDYASRKYKTSANSAELGLISNPANKDSPTKKPESEHDISQERLSMVPSGTILTPNEEDNNESEGE